VLDLDRRVVHLRRAAPLPARPDGGHDRDLAMNARMDTVRVVEAPEGVELALKVAGPLVRSYAFLLDFVARASVMSAVSFLMVFGDVGMAVLLLLTFTIEWFYPVLFEVYWHGATPGKRALGLAVVRTDGTPVGWPESLLRNFLRTVDMLPVGYATGLISCVLSRDFQRLGDRVAGTVVVHAPKRERLPELAKAQSRAPGIALTAGEQAAIVEYASRCDGWTAARASELAGHLEPLTEAKGADGVKRVVGMARWLEGAQ
jgi:uncharacterized RDD family membrane protein YckC